MGPIINTLRLARIFWVLSSHGLLWLLIKLFCLKSLAAPDLQKLGTKLAIALPKLGPAFVKLGQLLSTRPDLIGPVLAAELAKLQDSLPPHPFVQLRPTIEQQLKINLADAFPRIMQEAHAAASIAQVYRAETREGEKIAIKVLRPYIEKNFRKNLELLGFIVAIIENNFKDTGRFRLPEIVTTIAAITEVELDLRLEAAAADKIRQNSILDSYVYIPKVFWQYTRKKILVTEWIEGVIITDQEKLIAKGYSLPEITKKFVFSFFDQTYRDGFFHADLHPGNILINQQQQIVFLDCGIISWLDQKNKKFLLQILKGFIERDYDKVARAHFSAGYVPSSQSLELFALACRSIGEPIIGRPIYEISIAQLLGQLFSISKHFQMETQMQLLLLQKTMVTVEGIAYALCPKVNMWLILEEWLEINKESVLKKITNSAEAAKTEVYNIATQYHKLFDNILLLTDLSIKNHFQKPTPPSRSLYYLPIIILLIFILYSHLS